MKDALPPSADREKRRVLEQLLDEGMVMVHLDARRDGVDVPEHLRSDPALALNLSHRFHLDVFDIGSDAVEASLSFQGRTYLCRLPWTAIFALTSHVTGRSIVFPTSVPPELRPTLLAAIEAHRDEPSDPPPEPPRGRPKLRLVE